uniref:Rad21_Rec8 domain-containing protein n=1 Tax=Mesocestoides corti TaxID=53468 RepID=A0A5K3FM59_MESCO
GLWLIKQRASQLSQVKVPLLRSLLLSQLELHGFVTDSRLIHAYIAITLVSVTASAEQAKKVSRRHNLLLVYKCQQD